MIVELLIVLLGLVLFEIISSVDNAVINAQVLTTVSARARRWFVTWGLFVSVFLVRGLLPLIIVYIANPSLGLMGTFTASFSSDPAVAAAIAASKPVLLAGGGMYLVLLFLHWLLQENRCYAFGFEKVLRERYGLWFYALASILLVAITCVSIQTSPIVALGAVIGSSAFFITSGFKTNAEDRETELIGNRSSRSDFSKLLYLELIDATFSIDGVLGAFAFTTAVPLILIGNGIGAIVVRQVTIKGINVVKRLPYLTNGAMYSVAGLGTIMLLESRHVVVPFYITPLITITAVGYFGYRSWQQSYGLPHL
jgi:hypothetical protein